MAMTYQERVAAAMKKATNAAAAGASIAGASTSTPKVNTPPMPGIAGGVSAGAKPPTTAPVAAKPTPVAYTPPKTNTGVVPAMPNAVSSGGNAPALGYGGATYGSSGAANKAISANESKLQSDDNYRNSEIGRTLSVINARKAQGLDVADQEKYLTKNLGYTGNVSDQAQQPEMPAIPAMPQTFTPDTSSTPQIPTPTPTIPAMDWEAIQRYADQQIAADLAKQKSAADQAIARGQLTADQQTASLRQAAERLRGDITEQRGIENVENARRLSPFSGRSDYAQGMIERERGKTDRQLTENQQMQEANIQANLAQLRNEINAGYLALEQAGPAERERIIQQLRDSERQYSLQEAQLEIDRNLANSQLKNTDFGQQLASWQANRGAYEFDATFGYQRQQDQIRNDAQYGGVYNGQKTADQAAREWQQRFDYGNAIGQFGNGQKTLDMQRFEEDRKRYGEEWAYQKARDAIADERWKMEFDEDARRYGLNYALDQYQAKTSRQSSNNSAGNASFNKLMDVWRATGKAPSGLEGYGITPGSQYYDEVAERQGQQPTKVDAKDSADNYSEAIANMNTNTLSKGQAQTYAQGIRDYLTDSDYKALLKYIEDNM